MDVKVAFVIVCLCALAITTTEAGIPKCCIKTKAYISKDILPRIYKIVRQKSTGACDIDALQVYVRGRKKPLCVDPKVLDFLKGKALKAKKFKHVK